jgi:hypothetical protein
VHGVEVASEKVMDALRDPNFRNKVLNHIEKAIKTFENHPQHPGKAAEFNFLKKAMEKIF